MIAGSGKRSSDVFEFLQQDSKGNSKIEIENKNLDYELRLNSEVYISKEVSSKLVNPEFKKLVEQLGTNYDDVAVYKQYKQIIQRFGSQFIVGTEIGNTIRHDVYFKRSLLNAHSLSEIKSQASNIANAQDWFAKNSASKMVVSGKKDDPEALGFEVLPISILIDCPVKSKLMNLAIEEYNHQFVDTDPLDEKKIYTQDEIDEFFTIEI